MKATEATQPVQTVGKRELFAWALVLAFVFSSLGVVSGWFVRSEAMAPVVVQSSESK